MAYFNALASWVVFGHDNGVEATWRVTGLQNTKGAITRKRWEIRQKFVLTTNSKPLVGFQNLPPFWSPWQRDWVKRNTLGVF